MATKKATYTEEQIRILEQNPYTHSVAPNKFTVTLEFKEFFMSLVHQPGMTTPKILKAAGYDPKMFSRSVMDHMRINILAEAASETGLKPPRGLSQAERTAAFAKKNLDSQRTSTSIKELQNRIVHLERQVEFLKKFQTFISNPRRNKQKRAHF